MIFNKLVLSNIFYSALIVVLFVRFIEIKDKKWLYYIIGALLLITVVGLLFRYLLTFLLIYDARPKYEGAAIKNKYKTNGMPSLHALSIGYILPYILRSDINLGVKIISVFLGFISLYLRYIARMHNILQLFVGVSIGICLSFIINF